MSPGSPDASDELQVIPRRPSEAPGPSSGSSGRPPLSSAPAQAAADPVRQKRLTRIVAVALGLCAFILVAAGIARAMRPRAETASPATSPSATASAAPTSSASAAPPAAAAPIATAPPAPATGTVVFDKPAAPGKIWVDGKKITTRSVDLPCGTHKIKIGLYGKTKPVPITCGAELHLSR